MNASESCAMFEMGRRAKLDQCLEKYMSFVYELPIAMMIMINGRDRQTDRQSERNIESSIELNCLIKTDSFIENC